MTEVLSAPGNGASHFSSVQLRRSSSHALISLDTSSNYLESTTAKSSYGHSEYESDLPNSTLSSAASSPRLTHNAFSSQPSYSSTPASSLSLDTKGELEDEVDMFPSYDGSSPYCQEVETTQEPLSKVSDELQEPVKQEPKYATSDVHHAGDDHTIEIQPTRHVDYLSHEWKEEDIWSSWRYIVSRRNVYSNSVRLENASWRTWAKAKGQLKTVSPEALNWLKDCDVTWLYGPLQTDTKKRLSNTTSPPASRLSSSSSFLHKKPILKKKSASEVMLQRSISEHSLLKHAGAILKAQAASPSRGRPTFGRATSDFSMGTFSQCSLANTPAYEDSHSSASLRPSVTSSGLQSPGERRHIHFNNEVVQCIALESKDDDEEEEEEEEEEEQSNALCEDDDDEDEGVVMMKQVPPRARLSNRSTPRGSFGAESKTIALLPSTTLKYRGDTPEPSEALQPQAPNPFWPLGGAKLSPSPSQETLRPPRPKANFLLDDDEEDADLQWQPMPNKYSGSAQEPSSSYRPDSSSDEEYDPGPGMRRTASGMFMPYDEDEDEAAMNVGLFGRVVDTVNTARDIAHVIWNVGWRR